MAKEEKSKLKEKVLEGIYGPKELKKEEKQHYLGEYEERVIRYLTKEQVLEPGVYPAIYEAIRHPEASKLIIARDIDLERARDYINLASEKNLRFKRVDSPDLKGDVGLIVAADNAVDIDERKVFPRKERLRSVGISDKIIENVGAKLCDDCWEELMEKAPQERINYEKMSLLDRLFGTKCICKEGI